VPLRSPLSQRRITTPRYERRRPEQTMLYRIIEKHVDAFFPHNDRRFRRSNPRKRALADRQGNFKIRSFWLRMAYVPHAAS
jgi:hypothetical protein